MSELTTIARPYARAAYDFAKEHNAVEQWLNMLMFIDGIVSNSDFQQILKTGNQVLITTVLAKVSENYLNEYGINFVKLLIENKRLDVIGDILKEFKKIKDDDESVMNVEIVSAEKLSSSDFNKLLKFLKNKYQKVIKMSNTVDPSILGGVIIKTENDVLDDSLKHRIESLAEELNL